jgi:hypothetical protein
MKAKILVYALPALILATIHFAEAQQPKKFRASGSSWVFAIPIPGSRHSGKGCGISVITKGKISSLNTAPLSKRSVAEASLPSF